MPIHVTKPIDVLQLGDELTAAGVPHNGVSRLGTDDDAQVFTVDPATGEPMDLPPEAGPVVEAHDASKKARTAAFESFEDTERLRLINQRGREDPAFAALAELALRGKT